MYHGTIIQIDDCLVSEEILTEYFACDYEKCKGCCCVIGDSGAPLEECEAEAIEKNYPALLVSLYHRSEDIFELPLILHEKYPDYKFYMRRREYIPAWDTVLLAVKETR